MESVFFKNMPEATVNRTNRKTKKNKDSEETLAETFPSGFFFCCFFWLFLVFVVFFCFSFKLCKKLSGRTLGKQKDAKSRSWGWGRAYIYIDLIISQFRQHCRDYTNSFAIERENTILQTPSKRSIYFRLNKTRINDHKIRIL